MRAGDNLQSVAGKSAALPESRGEGHERGSAADIAQVISHHDGGVTSR